MRKTIRLITPTVAAGVLLCGMGAGHAVGPVDPMIPTEPAPGGSLNPMSIPKYVTPLVIPPVMKATGRSQAARESNVGAGAEYDVALRQFQQQILPGGIWAFLNPDIKNLVPPEFATNGFPATTVWSYGPKADGLPDSSGLGGGVGIAPAPNSQFNYPAFTMENTKDVRTTVNWLNELTTGAWDSSTGPGEFLPHLLPVDQTLHWANPTAECKIGADIRTDCEGASDQPYQGPVPMVAHLHGAHVGAAGDGYTEAWWLPSADNIQCVGRDQVDNSLLKRPAGPVDVDGDGNVDHWEVACEGGVANMLTNRKGKVVENTNNPDFPQNTQGYDGSTFIGYHNDQPSATLWFHDHSLGITRLNVYAGPAGFYLIREADGGETGLAAGVTLPGPAPQPQTINAQHDVLSLNTPGNDVRGSIREIPIAIQGRSFNADGSLYYPNNRAFFEGLNASKCTEEGQTDCPELNQFQGAGSLNIDTDPTTGTTDIAPIWNPEAFFNTMVVNGVTWPKLEVAPALYRLRLLNGTQSRFLNLALPITTDAANADGSVQMATATKRVPQYEDNGRAKKMANVIVDELRFWQIGAEQSLKPTVTAVRTGFQTNNLTRNLDNVRRKGQFGPETPTTDTAKALVMGPAERADVIVDFRGLPNGTVITMTNNAPDAPFGGAFDPPHPGTTGQVMRFVVNHDLLGLAPTDHIYASGKNEKKKFTYYDYFGKKRRGKNDKDHTSANLNPNAASDPWNFAVDPAALGNFTVVADNAANPRKLSLNELGTDKVCVKVSVDGGFEQVPGYTVAANGDCVDDAGNVAPANVGFFDAPRMATLGIVDANGQPVPKLWSEPLTTNVDPNGDGLTREQWDIENWTVDGHPIHLHLVGFKVIGRQTLDGLPSIAVPDTVDGVEPWEDGWKDTVITYPGETTSVVADFDINGLYVWHCHVLEHEDNEMMVPLCVGPKANCPTTPYH